MPFPRESAASPAACIDDYLRIYWQFYTGRNGLSSNTDAAVSTRYRFGSFAATITGPL